MELDDWGEDPSRAEPERQSYRFVAWPKDARWGVIERRHWRWAEPAEHQEATAVKMAALANHAYATGLTDALFARLKAQRARAAAEPVPLWKWWRSWRRRSDE